MREVVVLCAWCGKRKQADDSWQDDDNIRPSSYIVSHGICPECRAKIEIPTKGE